MRLRALGLKRDCLTLTAKNQWKGTVSGVTLELTSAPTVGKNVFLISIAQKSDTPSITLTLTPPKGKATSPTLERNAQGQHVAETTLDTSGKWQAKIEMRRDKKRLAAATFEFVVTLPRMNSWASQATLVATHYVSA